MFALRAFAVPSVPVNLLATPANARVTVTWSAVTGATGYNVYRSLTPGSIGADRARIFLSVEAGASA